MRARLKLREALAIAERDDVGKCESCPGLALDGEKFCSPCKSYWEEDAPRFSDVDWTFHDYEDE